MIEIYGPPNSSAGRCFWCLEEVGAKYEAKPINMREKEHKSPQYLLINPNGKVPSLKDSDFVIWESIAINMYLAESYKPELLGKDLKQRGHINQWNIWSIAELQPPLIEVFIQLVFVPEERRDLKVIEKAQGKLPNLFRVLDDSLKGKAYLVGESFTLADLNVASTVSLCQHINYDLSEYKNINSWLSRATDRPSYKKYMELCN